MAILARVRVEEIIVKFFWFNVRYTFVPEHARDNEHSDGECGANESADEISRFSTFLVDGELARQERLLLVHSLFYWLTDYLLIKHPYYLVIIKIITTRFIHSMLFYLCLKGLFMANTVIKYGQWILL